MTEEQHPINPPLDLIKTWMIEYYGGEIPGGFAGDEVYLCKCAAQWGADQELESCVKLLELSDKNARDFLYSARRPKPPSLKEQALVALHAVATGANNAREQHLDLDTIRRALEQLNEGTKTE
jgi:hypothetical protein